MRLIDADEAKKLERMVTLKPSEKALFKLMLDRMPTYEPPNPPLTVDELREMDGMPVWVELINIDRPNAWFLLNLRDDEAVNKRGGFVSLMDYGKTWLAYRRKPEDYCPECQRKEAERRGY